MRWTLSRALIVLTLTLLLSISPASAQAEADQQELTPHILWDELLPTLIGSLITGGGVVGLIARSFIKRQQDGFTERMAHLSSDSDEVKRKDELLKQLLELYGKKAMVTEDMVKELGRFGAMADRQASLLSDQTAVILTVGKDVTAHGSAIETVRGIMMQVLDEEKVQTKHGATVIQMLEDIASKVEAVLGKLKTRDLSQSTTAKLLAEAEPVLVTPPPQSN